MKKQLSNGIFDIIIIGGGPAGLTSALYCARAQKKTLVLDKGDSYLEKASKIENYFGIDSISGKELLEKGRKQALRFGALMKKEEVLSISLAGEDFEVKTNQNAHTCKFIILATGASQNSQKIENLEGFVGKGVSYCVTCDGFFFKDKKVAVIGSRNFAAHEALELLNYTKNVTIITNKEKVEIDPSILENLKKEKVEIVDKKIKKIIGKESAEEIELENNEKMKFDGIFVAVGSGNAASFAKTLGIELIKEKFIKVDSSGKTNFPKIYAGGDCIGGKQVATAVGEGARAAISILSEISQKEHIDYH